jgi:hypothetical protein
MPRHRDSAALARFEETRRTPEDRWGPGRLCYPLLGKTDSLGDRHVSSVALRALFTTHTSLDREQSVAQIGVRKLACTTGC